MTMTSSPPDRANLARCPFCNAEMLVREHSAFHPGDDGGTCWLEGYELDEHDYASWNVRAALRAAAPADWMEVAKEIVDALTSCIEPSTHKAAVEKTAAILATHAPSGGFAAEFDRIASEIETQMADTRPITRRDSTVTLPDADWERVLSAIRALTAPASSEGEK